MSWVQLSKTRSLLGSAGDVKKNQSNTVSITSLNDSEECKTYFKEIIQM